MSRRRVIYMHFFIWLFAIFANLPYTNFGGIKDPRQLVAYTIGFLYLMIIFYLFYLYIVPYFLRKKQIAAFFAVSFFAVLIMPFFGYSMLLFSKACFEGNFHNFYHDYSLKMHMSGYFPVLTAAMFGSFFSLIINWFTNENQKAELERQRLAAELNLLKSKLNPHFLFNTLNNIDSLIQNDPQKASSALIRLSDIMRYLTYDTASEKVPLSGEIKYISDLVELNRLRIKSAEDIVFTFEGDTNVMIAPAIFMPVIENVFKYAVFRTHSPAIIINLKSYDGFVTLETVNSCQRTSESPVNLNSGFGLANLRKRLELSYNNRYTLITEPSENLYRTILTIDTNDNQLHSN